MANKTYAPLPFSYLTGAKTSEKSPTYGVKTSTSNDDAEQGVVEHSDPYSIYAGKANQPAGQAPVGMRKSMDVTDSHLDVTDPYLLSTGRLSAENPGSDANITSDPRYRDTVPSASEGGNVFFRPPEGSDNVFPEPRPGYANPALEAGDDDTLMRANKKLPRYRVGTDSKYQYYSGSESSGPTNQDNKLGAPPSGQPVRGPSPVNAKGGMENANNPIWDKYYAGNTPTPTPGYDGYQSNSPTTPGVRPVTKPDDFNTLIRNSNGSDFKNRECCGSKRCAIITAIVVTAIICLGAGFAAGWFVYPVANPPAPESATTTTIAAPPAGTGTTGGVVGTTRPPEVSTAPIPATTTTTTTTATTNPTTDEATTTGLFSLEGDKE